MECDICGKKNEVDLSITFYEYDHKDQVDRTKKNYHVCLSCEQTIARYISGLITVYRSMK